MHSLNSYLNPAILVLAQYHYTKSALAYLAQKIVLFYAALTSEALLTENFSMPHLERFMTVKVD